MHKSQANRAVIAARLPGSPRPSRPVTTGTNPAMRAITTVHPCAAPVRNRQAPKMTAIQRDSTGAPSAWSRSASFFTDPKWSATVGEL